MSAKKRPHRHVLVVPMRPEHAAPLEALQRRVFPTLLDEELFTVPKYLRHLELFPEGQFVALAKEHGDIVVAGVTSTRRTCFDFNHIQHTFIEAMAGGWLTNHDPRGDWLYGVDLNVHPGHRGKGIARLLYNARRSLVQRLNLRGEVAGAMLPGYDRHRRKYSIEDYVRAVERGEAFDPTLTVQMRNGFKVVGVLYDHITDPRSDNCAALIMRVNYDYKPEGIDAASAH